MCRLWSRSVCVVLFLTCLACDDSDSSGNKSDAGPAAGGGGKSGAGGQGGSAGKGGNGSQTRDAGGDESGGKGGTSAGGRGGSGGSGGSGSTVEAPDVEPAECLPDPTSFTACGGNVVGKWRIASFCLDSGLDDLKENFMCPALTQEFKVDYRMLVEFTAGGDYLATFSSDVMQDVTVPKVCLGTDGNCSALGPDDPDPTDDGWTVFVTEAGDNCLMAAAQHSAESIVGSFETNGNHITVTDNDGPDTSEYCLDGDKLTVKSVDAASGDVTWGVFTRE